MSLDNPTVIVTNNGTIFICDEVIQLSNRLKINEPVQFLGDISHLGDILNGEESLAEFMQKLPCVVTIENSKLEFSCQINSEWPLSHLFE